MNFNTPPSTPSRVRVPNFLEQIRTLHYDLKALAQDTRRPHTGAQTKVLLDRHTTIAKSMAEAITGFERLHITSPKRRRKISGNEIHEIEEEETAFAELLQTTLELVKAMAKAPVGDGAKDG